MSHSARRGVDERTSRAIRVGWASHLARVVSVGVLEEGHDKVLALLQDPDEGFRVYGVSFWGLGLGFRVQSCGVGFMV